MRGAGFIWRFTSRTRMLKMQSVRAKRVSILVDRLRFTDFPRSLHGLDRFSMKSIGLMAVSQSVIAKSTRYGGSCQWELRSR